MKTVAVHHHVSNALSSETKLPGALATILIANRCPTNRTKPNLAQLLAAIYLQLRQKLLADAVNHREASMSFQIGQVSKQPFTPAVPTKTDQTTFNYDVRSCSFADERAYIGYKGANCLNLIRD